MSVYVQYVTVKVRKRGCEERDSLTSGTLPRDVDTNLKVTGYA